MSPRRTAGESIKLLLRCVHPACRAPIEVEAAPVGREGEILYARFYTGPPGKPAPIEACPQCGGRLPRLRWSRIPMVALANRIEIEQAAAEGAPTPKEIIARAAEIRASWADPEVRRARHRAFANEEKDREARAPRPC